jgi:acyl transferase domain-containing protein
MHASFIEGVHLFDNKRFGISSGESSGMDPQQRVGLEVGYDAMYRSSAITTSASRAIAVIVGQMNYDWMTGCAANLAVESGAFLGCSLSPAIASNRISYCLGLKGPSMTIDTACSSSLVTAYVAATQIR